MGCWSALWLLLAADPATAANCGVTIPRTPGAPVDAFHPISIGNSDSYDLDDQLFSGPSKKAYNRLRKDCANGDGPKCWTFGLQYDEWNLTYPHILQVEGPKQFDGKVHTVIESGRLTRKSLQKWAALPYLHALSVTGVADEDFSGMALPASLRVVSIDIGEGGSWVKLAELMRAQGHIRSVFLRGKQNIKNWLKVDLSELCGLDLFHFTGFVMDVVGSAIPQCWSKMTNLKTFYCTNCMMNAPPTALKGMQKLTVFVAFRQSEMVPCALNDVAKDAKNCKPSWETKHGFKEGGMRDSTDQMGDFQEGPSFLCPESAYAFPFKDIVDLGWTNVLKVWLDGNFMTGPIPENIADVWPSLQSLDLYNNDMSGPIPESLAKLDFVKLQLQDNAFSGELPQKLVQKMMNQKVMTWGISGNPALGGCLPKKLYGRGNAGTNIVKCTTDKNSEL